ncbi:hypothetical protein EVAR_49293_1 [Eumeta japonica]|uniref:Uncharacterized protein n=1 Tax=Eumeta variegata TaxID=151549 RepID=A0A4C1XQL7_EUMVA|nr:hypothetical protein EVAR_49293_1 [Eumeta japonica]
MEKDVLLHPVKGENRRRSLMYERNENRFPGARPATIVNVSCALAIPRLGTAQACCLELERSPFKDLFCPVVIGITGDVAGLLILYLTDSIR